MSKFRSLKIRTNYSSDRLRGIKRYKSRNTRYRRIRKGKTRLTKAIARALDRRVETKVQTYTGDQYFNSAISSVSEMYNLIPTIAQGYGDSQRIGQKIRMKFLKFKGMLSYETAIGTSNNLPIYATIFIFSDKIQRSSNAVPNSANLLASAGQPTQWDGTITTSLLPFNTEDFVLIKRKTVRLSYNWAPGNSSTGLVDPTRPLQRMVSFKIPVYNKICDYESSSANLPQNCNYRFAIGFTQYTNTVQTAAPLRFQYTTTCYYKDD